MKWSRRDREQLDALDKLYAALPRVACKGLCAGACASIPLTDLEARRLQAATHKKPRTLPMAATDQPGAGHVRCVYLTASNRCEAYAERPLICRVYAVLETMSCPFGCVPDRWMGTLEFFALAQRVENIGGGRVLKTGPQGLEDHGESYARLANTVRTSTRSPQNIAENDTRTRHLRALHGGRIILAFTDEDKR